MNEQYPIDVEPGEEADIKGRRYLFSRVDPDGGVIYRAPAGAHYGDFKVPDADGFPRYPNGNELGVLMRKGELIHRGRPRPTEARRLAHEKQLDTKQVHAMDPKAEVRIFLERRYDEAPWGTSDGALRAFMKDALADPVYAEMVERVSAILLQREQEKRDVEARRVVKRREKANRARIADGLPPIALEETDSEPEEAQDELVPWNGMVPPSTLRDWLDDRGEPGRRHDRDGLDGRGRHKRGRKVRHPREILMYHASRAAISRAGFQAHHDSYITELACISTGQAIDRYMLEDPDGGDFSLSDRKAEYPQPPVPYEGNLYHSFWRLAHDLMSADTYAMKTSDRAAENRYGGGGRAGERTHVGAMSWMDDTPVPVLFLVDDDTGIPMGLCSLIALRESRTTVAIGWKLVPGGPSTSAVLKVVEHANNPKDVPADLLALEENLAWMRLRPDRIGFDNTLAAHGKSVEDVLLNAYIGCRYAGKEQPRDKGGIERMLEIFQDLLFKRLPDANFDVERMRRYDFDPDKQVLCGYRKACELLDRAAYTYNLATTRAHDGRQRSLVWNQLTAGRKLAKIEDLDQYKRSIGRLEEATMRNSGIEILNRRFTPGAKVMKAITQRMERGRRLPKGDITPTQKRKSSNDRHRLTFKVRIKIDDDDIGRIQVWIPFPADKAEWVTFECTDAAAHGMPLWLHHACLDFAKREALEYMTAEQQAIVRSRLFEDIAGVNAASSERDRRLLTRTLSNPHTRAVLGQIVEVSDEPEPEAGELPPEPDDSVGFGMAGTSRKDMTPLPRQRPKASSEPAALRRRDRTATAITTNTKKRDPNARTPRREPRSGAAKPGKGVKNTDSRNSGAAKSAPTTQSANRPDQRSPGGGRSKRLKWEDMK